MTTEWNAQDDVHSSLASRRRQSGVVCCICEVLLSLPEEPGERYCRKCEAARASSRRIYMSFTHLAAGWECRFFRQDMKTPLRKKLLFVDAEKVRTFVFRGGASMFAADQNTLEHAILSGHGSLWLNLSAEQYNKLM